MTQIFDTRVDEAFLKTCGLPPKYHAEYLKAIRQTYSYTWMTASFALHDLVDVVVAEIKKLFVGGTK